jgi:hypothetical protein
MSNGERSAGVSAWRWGALAGVVGAAQAGALFALTGSKLSVGGHGALLAVAICLPFVILAGAGVLRGATAQNHCA